MPLLVKLRRYKPFEDDAFKCQRQKNAHTLVIDSNVCRYFITSDTFYVLLVINYLTLI